MVIKIDNFFSYLTLSQHPVDPNIAFTDPELGGGGGGGGVKGPGHPGKTQVIGFYRE